MAEINPAEVSAILKQQLANFDTQTNVEEVVQYYKLETVSL